MVPPGAAPHDVMHGAASSAALSVRSGSVLRRRGLTLSQVCVGGGPGAAAAAAADECSEDPHRQETTQSQPQPQPQRSRRSVMLSKVSSTHRLAHDKKLQMNRRGNMGSIPTMSGGSLQRQVVPFPRRSNDDGGIIRRAMAQGQARLPRRSSDDDRGRASSRRQMSPPQASYRTRPAFRRCNSADAVDKLAAAAAALSDESSDEGDAPSRSQRPEIRRSQRQSRSQGQAPTATCSSRRDDDGGQRRRPRSRSADAVASILAQVEAAVVEDNVAEAETAADAFNGDGRPTQRRSSMGERRKETTGAKSASSRRRDADAERSRRATESPSSRRRRQEVDESRPRLGQRHGRSRSADAVAKMAAALQADEDEDDRADPRRRKANPSSGGRDNEDGGQRRRPRSRSADAVASILAEVNAAVAEDDVNLVARGRKPSGGNPPQRPRPSSRTNHRRPSNDSVNVGSVGSLSLILDKVDVADTPLDLGGVDENADYGSVVSGHSIASASFERSLRDFCVKEVSVDDPYCMLMDSLRTLHGEIDVNGNGKGGSDRDGSVDADAAPDAEDDGAEDAEDVDDDETFRGSDRRSREQSIVRLKLELASTLEDCSNDLLIRDLIRRRDALEERAAGAREELRKAKERAGGASDLCDLMRRKYDLLQEECRGWERRMLEGSEEVGRLRAKCRRAEMDLAATAADGDATCGPKRTDSKLDVEFNESTEMTCDRNDDLGVETSETNSRQGEGLLRRLSTGSVHSLRNILSMVDDGLKDEEIKEEWRSMPKMRAAQRSRRCSMSALSVCSETLKAAGAETNQSSQPLKRSMSSGNLGGLLCRLSFREDD